MGWDKAVTGGKIHGKNLDKSDWQLCKKCGSRHPDQDFINEVGVERKTCNFCRERRNKRKLEDCQCKRCFYCRRRAANNEVVVKRYKHNHWELLGGHYCYLNVHLWPDDKISDIYAGKDIT